MEVHAILRIPLWSVRRRRRTPRIAWTIEQGQDGLKKVNDKLIRTAVDLTRATAPRTQDTFPGLENAPRAILRLQQARCFEGNPRIERHGEGERGRCI